MVGGPGAFEKFYMFSENKYDMFRLNFEIMLSKEQRSALMTKQYKELTADCKWDF